MIIKKSKLSRLNNSLEKELKSLLDKYSKLTGAPKHIKFIIFKDPKKLKHKVSAIYDQSKIKVL